MKKKSKKLLHRCRPLNRQKFFAPFFQKRSACFLLLACTAAAPSACFTNYAATRGYTLGLPRQAELTPDGRTALYLRSGPRDTQLGLFRLDLATGQETELARPASGPEHLSVAERARRERARMTLSGITDYALARDGRSVLVSQADSLARITLPDGAVHPLPGADWLAPRLSPDGRVIAAVRANDLHVLDTETGADRQLTQGGTDTLTHGLAEFVASEELDRFDGAWWSPDSATLLYEESDTSGVEPHFIADPAHPERPPSAFRYPRAGTANARLRLGLVPRDGGPTRWLDWDSAAFPYLVRVVWPAEGHAPLTLVVMNRAETEQRLLTVDPATGHTTTLLRETDPAWINTSPGANWPSTPLPHWLPDGSGFLWASDSSGAWRLALHHADGTLDHVVTPANQPFLSLADVDVAHQTATVLLAPNRIDAALYRVPLAGGAPQPVAIEPGQHAATFNELSHTAFVDHFDSADGHLLTQVRDASGRILATLPSHAEPPPAAHVQFTTAGAQAFDAAVLRPTASIPGRHYPVVLSVYAGPGVKTVLRAPRLFNETQCLADQGFIVVALDGRGTPGRGHDWERATKGNLIDLPLADQIAGLQALAQQFPEMDASRVGVTGWSFGGYFTAMATIRRPDIFTAGVAGAPPVDWADYDTAYTERYLGTPAANQDAYHRSNVLTYAAALARPLLIMHGLTDDNVYFVNTVKLTEALLRAGRPYDLLLLPGTHQLPDPVLRANVDAARARYFTDRLSK